LHISQCHTSCTIQFAVICKETKTTGKVREIQNAKYLKRWPVRKLEHGEELREKNNGHDIISPYQDIAHRKFSNLPEERLQ